MLKRNNLLNINILIILINSLFVVGCDENKVSFLDYLTQKKDFLDKNFAKDFQNKINNVNTGTFLILNKDKGKYILNESDYSKSYPEKNNFSIHLINEDNNIFLFELEKCNLSEIDSIVDINIRNYLDRKDKLVYEFFIPKKSDSVSYKDAFLALKMIKKFNNCFLKESDENSKYIPVVFFIFKEDYAKYNTQFLRSREHLARDSLVRKKE